MKTNDDLDVRTPRFISEIDIRWDALLVTERSSRS